MGAFQQTLMGSPHSGIDVVNSINLGKKLLLPIPAAKISSGLLNTISETTKWGSQSHIILRPRTIHLKCIIWG